MRFKFLKYFQKDLNDASHPHACKCFSSFFRQNLKYLAKQLLRNNGKAFVISHWELLSLWICDAWWRNGNRGKMETCKMNLRDMQFMIFVNKALRRWNYWKEFLPHILRLPPLSTQSFFTFSRMIKSNKERNVVLRIHKSNRLHVSCNRYL